MGYYRDGCRVRGELVVGTVDSLEPVVDVGGEPSNPDPNHDDHLAKPAIGSGIVSDYQRW